jgi:hypothetical protein
MRDPAFAPKSLTPPEYVRALFASTDNVAVLVRNRAGGRTLQRIAPADRVASSEFQEWLAVESARGSDIYIGMNPIKGGAYSRTKDNIKDIRHVYLDLDGDGDASLQAIRDSLIVPGPNFVLDTSPGKHQVIWKVSEFHQAEAESLLRALSDHFGGDPAATDSTRVLRLPGFANRKLSEPFIVGAQQESDALHTPRDFAALQDSLQTPARLRDNREPRPARTSGHHSQSESDWAYAKRALARGDDPETVIQRIADFRAEDKPDPMFYARLTVAKAGAAGRERPNSSPEPSDEATRGTP